MQKKEAKRTLPHSDFFSKNRKGQGLSTSAIVLIILGVAILVFLILGFTMGWSKVLPFLGSDNVDSTINQCTAACASSSTYKYCKVQRELKGEGVPADAEGTCEDFAEKYSSYGFEKCDVLEPCEATEPEENSEE